MAVIAPINHLVSSANVITDVTGGGITTAGTYLLNIINDDSADTTLEVWITGATDIGLATPAAKHKIEPGAPFKGKDVVSRWPLSLEVDARIWVRVGIASKISVNLSGRSE